LLANPAPPRPRHVRPFLAPSRAAFFDGDNYVGSKKSPDRGATAWNSLRVASMQRSPSKGQIRCSATRAKNSIPRASPTRRGSRRSALCSDVFRVTPAPPPHRRTALAKLSAAFPRILRPTTASIPRSRQSIRIGCGPRFGPPEPRINAQDSLTHTQLGIPDSLLRKRSTEHQLTSYIAMMDSGLSHHIIASCQGNYFLMLTMDAVESYSFPLPSFWQRAQLTAYLFALRRQDRLDFAIYETLECYCVAIFHDWFGRFRPFAPRWEAVCPISRPIFVVISRR